MAEKITSKLESWNTKPSVAIKWNSTSVLLNQWENWQCKLESNLESTLNAIYTSLFPSKGALPSLSIDCSLNQCILENKSHSKMAIKEIVLMKTLHQNGNNRNHVDENLAILVKDKNHTRPGDFHSSLYSMLHLSPFPEHKKSFI